MPKLTTDQIIDRIERRIAELEAGDEIANKHIRALLTDTQQQALDDALDAQAELKKAKRARTEDEKKALGWKTIREVRLEVLRLALAEANSDLLADFQRRQNAAAVRQTKIYFDAVSSATKEGKDLHVAKNWANNELTRAGLQRLDGQKIVHDDPRDKQIAEMEDTLRAQIKSRMTPEQREQQDMLEEMDKAKRLRRTSKGSVARTKK